MAKLGVLILCSTVLLSVTLIDAQNTGSPPRKPPAHRGLVLTVRKSFYTTQDAAQIRSIPAIPYYDDWDYKAPGIKFSNSDIHFLSVDANYQKKLVYLYDYHFKALAIGEKFNPDLEVGNMTFDFMHEGVSKATIQIAYDWLSRTLYWVDAGFGWIAAAPGDPELIDEDYYKIIVKNLDKPDGIALAPHAGFLFYSDNGKAKQIGRTTLDGANRRTILHRNIHFPRALEADQWSQRIFWLDSFNEEINSADYDGTHRQIVRRIAEANLFDIAIYQEMVIISDISDGYIYFLNKTTGKSMFSTIRIGSEITYGIAVYTEDNQPGKDTDHCLELQCPHLCLTMPPPDNAKCVCSEGFEYYAANKSCIERAGSYHRAMILLSPTEICYGDIRSLASYTFNATCVFTTTMPTTPYPTTTPFTRTTNRPTTSARSSRSTTTSRQRTTTYRQRTTLSRRSTTRSIQRTRAPTTPLEPPEEILFMDLDMEERMIYFASEKNIYSRSIDQTTYGNIKTGVTATNLIISGLVYDWIDRYNLYYSTTIGYIYVKNVKDTSVSRIIQGTTTMVGNLVLMPHERMLAWTASGSSSSKIESAGVGGGGDIETIIDGRAQITSLTYDQHTKTFYWIESDYVYQFKPNGSSAVPKMIRYNFVDTAFFLQVYKNSLIVAEKEGNSTHYFTKYVTLDLTTSGTFKTVKAEGTFLNLPDVTHFKILDTELQPNETSFCKNDNGNCEQICLTTHDGYGNVQKRCECSYGFHLQENGVSCQSAPKTDTDFLLVTDWTHSQINQVDQNTEQFHALDLDRTGRPKGVLYNPLTDLVMYSLDGPNEVYAIKLNGTTSEIFVELDDYSSANRFALDETTGNIYYTSPIYNYIGIITPHQSYIEFYGSLADLVYSDVTAIALHPGKGYMYYAVQDLYSYIGRAYMDGSNSEMLINRTVTNETLRWPDGLAIDYTRDHLYWSDRLWDTIEKCDLNGKNCVLFTEDRGADFSDLVTDGDYLYYTSYIKGIIKVDLNNATKTVKVGTETETGRLVSLSLYKKETNNKQTVSDGCKANDGKGLCSTICLPQPYGKFSCACDNGVPFKDDTRRTCSDVFQCDEFVGSAQAPSSCTRYADSSCDLVCQPGFMPATTSTNMTMFCSKVGWAMRDDLCIEAKCPLTITKVAFDTTCSGKFQEVCSYTCAAGYTPIQNPATVECLSGPRWNISTDFCKETTCPVDNVIPNGAFTSSCEGKINTVCDFTCDPYYTPSIKPPRITCQSTGSWKKNVTAACTATECPNTLSNGMVDANCTRSVGSNCKFSCNADYVVTADEIVCTANGAWSPANACKRKPCSKIIKNGAFTSACSGEYNAECEFTCNGPYYKPSITTKLTCAAGGKWQTGQTDINMDTLCSEVLCSGGIPNAALVNSCDKKALSKCDFTCNTGYEKNPRLGVSEAMCMDTGTWSTNNVTACVASCGSAHFRCASGQCIPKKQECDNTTNCDDGSDEGDRCVACSGIIPKGLLDSCDLTIGRRCNYTCTEGFRKVTDTVVCLIGGEWNSQSPCEEILCNDDIPDAIIVNPCDKKMSSTCDFKCDKGFVKNTGVEKATCTKSSTWSTNNVTACVMRCTNTIDNGALVKVCDRKVGKRCNFTCNGGFSKATDELICTTGGAWQITNPCQVTLCPRAVQNGEISSDCKMLTVGKSCKVKCNTHYKQVKSENVKCLPSGEWSVSKGICEVNIVKPPQKQQQPAAGISGGAIAGIIIGVIILIVAAAVVAFVVLYKRRLLPGRFGPAPSAKYSTSDIAIENPGYMNANINVTDDTRIENPYDTANDYQPMGYSNGPEPLDRGYVNPMYKTKINVGSEEPLPEQSDIVIHQDDVVLTTDSWQREQLKGPEA